MGRRRAASPRGDQRLSHFICCQKRKNRIHYCSYLPGPLAHLVERFNGIEEVTGSSPVGSTLEELGVSNSPKSLIITDKLAVPNPLSGEYSIGSEKTNEKISLLSLSLIHI